MIECYKSTKELLFDAGKRWLLSGLALNAALDRCSTETNDIELT